jgi:FkbM family methyltransferase
VKPGMCIWDLGANQGLFAFAAAARAGVEGEVFAFEPDPYLVALLEHSLSSGSHNAAAVHVMPLALSDKVSIGQFLIAQTDRTLNHLAVAKGNPRTCGFRTSRPVMMVTLDWLGEHLKPPNLIKIDVEGGESLVLHGSQELLRRHRPIVIIEVAQECALSVSILFAEANYLMFDIQTPQDGPITQPAWNTLALPAERAQAMV